MRNLIPKTDINPKYFVATANSKMLIAMKALDVPEHHTNEGFLLINPPPSERVSISEALASPVKKKISISGKIVQVNTFQQIWFLLLHMLIIRLLWLYPKTTCQYTVSMLKDVI
jgi:hypothetical protein